MTPFSIDKLMNVEPQRITSNLSWLIGSDYNHIPEMGIDPIDWKRHSRYHKLYGFEFRILREVWFDERRCLVLGLIVLHGYPVMVTHNAGREGRDQFERFICDVPRYKDRISLLRHNYPRRVRRGRFRGFLDLWYTPPELFAIKRTHSFPELTSVWFEECALSLTPSEIFQLFQERMWDTGGEFEHVEQARI